MLYFIAIFVLLIIIAFIYTMIYQKHLKKEGIETTGIVRIETVDKLTADEFFDTSTSYYVTYKNEESKEAEATISNPKKDLKTGDKIKIKYLPKNPRYAYYIEKVK